MPQIGDIVEGTVKSINEDGAFVEIDSYRVKSWAQIPTKYASLKPVSSVEEAGLEVGKVIKAAVVDEGAAKRRRGEASEPGWASVVPGDSMAAQHILLLAGSVLGGTRGVSS